MTNFDAARKLLGDAEEAVRLGYLDAYQGLVAIAQVYATLAVAEQVRASNLIGVACRMEAHPPYDLEQWRELIKRARDLIG